MNSTDVTVALGTIVVFGVGAQWLGRKTGIPSIVLLLLAGIVAGPITGLVDPEALLGDTLEPAVTLAVGLLLFDSGFSLRISELTAGRAIVYRLVSIGMIITWVVGSVASYYIFDLRPEVAWLLGAVLVVSGPTVVGPILQMARPRRATGQILEWEGTLLDPIGATLGIVVLTVITAGTGPLGAIGLTLLTAATGILVGLVCTLLLVFAVRNFAMPDDLQVPVAFMFAVLAFCVANVTFSESGLFATLTMGLVLANQPFAYVRRIQQFQASIGTLVIATLFIVLAATIQLADLQEVLIPSGALLAVLVLIARPLAATVATWRSRMDKQDRIFIGSVAPRGIVAASTVSFYAITLSSKGIAAEKIVPITFAIIIGAGVVYGFGSPAMAKLLKVGQGKPKGVAFFMPLDAVETVADALAKGGVPVIVVDDDLSEEQIQQKRPYQLFGSGIDSEGLEPALADANTGAAVIGTGLNERDLIAMTIVSADIGANNVYVVPSAKKAMATGIEGRWRSQTPDRRIAFGPNITRAELANLLGDNGKLTWLPASVADSQVPPGTTPLFIVDSDGRGIVANETTMQNLRRQHRNHRNHRNSGAKVLCITSTPPKGPGNPTIDNK